MAGGRSSLRRLAIGGAAALLVLALIYGWASTWFEMIEHRTMSQHNLALASLMLEVAGDTCVGPDAMERAAEKMGWTTERLQAPYESTLYDDALPVALNIHVTPPIWLNKLRFTVFQFDDRGCLEARI